MGSGRETRVRLFNAGSAAFAAKFPEWRAQLSGPHYVCPLCLTGFPFEAIDEVLTVDHVPPKSVGGATRVLTCRNCNSAAGAALEAHAKHEHDWIDFAEGRLHDVRASMITASGELPVRLTVEGRAMKMFGVEAVNPATRGAIIQDLNTATTPEGAEKFSFEIAMGRFSPKAAAVTWLKAAYLAFFAALGYTWILRPELNLVRERIRNPEGDEPKVFRLTQPTSEPASRRLLRLDKPDDLRSFAMSFGKFMIFLPRFNDGELYSRLAAKHDANEKAAGIEFPWPTTPTYRWDYRSLPDE